MSFKTQPKCKRCHKNSVCKPGQVCGACRKPGTRSASASRPAGRAFRAADVLNKTSSDLPVAHGHTDSTPAPAFSTSDLLQLHQPSLTLVDATPQEFWAASYLAGLYNDWLTGRGAFARAADADDVYAVALADWQADQVAAGFVEQHWV